MMLLCRHCNRGGGLRPDPSSYYCDARQVTYRCSDLPNAKEKTKRALLQDAARFADEFLARQGGLTTTEFTLRMEKVPL